MSNDFTEKKTTPADPIAPTPRAFVTATGLVFQLTGLVHIFLAGGYWLISGRVQAEAPVRIDSLREYVQAQNVLLSVTTVWVLAAVSGGLAMVAFGIGLQGEKRSSGLGAMISSGMLALVAMLCGISYLVWGPAIGRAIIAGLEFATATVLFLLAGHSADELRRHPPPENQSVVDDEWLEEYARNRRARRGSP